MSRSTTDLVLEALHDLDLRDEGDGQYRSNRPWSNNSDSLGLTLKVDGPELGTYYDHVDDCGGSLYDLAERLGITPNGYKPTETKQAYEGLSDYAKAHGVPRQAFIDANWKETIYQDRPALEFPTRTGKRWRFTDGERPTFKSEKGYKQCWFGLRKAIENAKKIDHPIVICNGEPSVISAHHWGVPAIAVTSGEKSKLPENLLEELREKWSGEIIITPDCDATGRTMAEGFVNQLGDAGYAVRAVNLNGGKGFDLADFCMLHQENSVEQIQNLEIIAQSNPKETSKIRWTVAELLDTEFPEPRWAVPNRIPVGLSILAGRPKVGKSWLALQLAHAKGSGGYFLDQKVSRGGVLFIALEDSPRRLQDRAKTQGIPFNASITFVTEWNKLIDGGFTDLMVEIAKDEYELIIDTYSRAVGNVDQLNMTETTDIGGNLQSMAIKHDLSILLIDHHTKVKGYDGNPVDDVLGSTGKSATADALLGLYREQGKHGATLKITGRDFEEQDIALQWDGLTCCWQSLGDANDVREDTLKGNIVQAIRELVEMGQLPTTTNISTHIDTYKSSVSRALADLVSTGQVIRGEKVGRQQPYKVSDLC